MRVVRVVLCEDEQAAAAEVILLHGAGERFDAAVKFGRSNYGVAAVRLDRAAARTQEPLPSAE